MVEGIDGFRIEDEDVDTTTKYMKPWSDFVMVKQWPAPTMGRREDRFKLYFQDQFITEFLWVDYQGGAINQPTDESDAAAQLHADIQESNAVIVIADAYTIATRPLIEARMLTSAPLIFHLLNSYKFKPAAEGEEGLNNGITIAIVLTKADALPDEFKANGYENFTPKRARSFTASTISCATSVKRSAVCAPALPVGDVGSFDCRRRQRRRRQRGSGLRPRQL